MSGKGPKRSSETDSQGWCGVGALDSGTLVVLLVWIWHS